MVIKNCKIPPNICLLFSTCILFSFILAIFFYRESIGFKVSFLMVKNNCKILPNICPLFSTCILFSFILAMLFFKKVLVLQFHFLSSSTNQNCKVPQNINDTTIKSDIVILYTLYTVKLKKSPDYFKYLMTWALFCQILNIDDVTVYDVIIVSYLC